MRRSVRTYGTALFFLSSALMMGQGLSTINGSVTDPSGAVVAGANITATEVDTSLARTTVSNLEGLYVIGGLRPTRYTLSIGGRGFRQFTQTGIVLEANDTVTINVKLEVGSTTETISVNASAVQVDTTTATIRQVVD